MKLLALVVATLGGLVAIPQLVVGLAAGDADTMFNAVNSVFLKTNGDSVYYKAALDKDYADQNWAAALDILLAEDAYETTGDADRKTLVENLMTTWLANTPPSQWYKVSYNDDLGWYTLSLIRAYQITQNPIFLNESEFGFNFAYNRGWDTSHNGGGLYECQPSMCGSSDKYALSTQSLGTVVCVLYQATHNPTYYKQCLEIYNWTRTHLMNQNTGEVYFGVASDGTIRSTAAAFDQGRFVVLANLVYEITLNRDYYNDALKAMDYARHSLTNSNGIFDNTDKGYNTWADEVARAVGHFVADNRLWDTYYDWVVDNANAALKNRRPDLGITWNGWDQPTTMDNTIMVNWYLSAPAWLLVTPVNKPNNMAGIHVITNQQTGLAIDSEGNFGLGNPVNQYAENDGINQTWQLTQNRDGSWNIISLATWLALDCPGGSNAENLGMIMWQPHRKPNQRWMIDEQSDGSYKIWNQESLLALDGAGCTDNNGPLVQTAWNGGASQRWILK